MVPVAVKGGINVPSTPRRALIVIDVQNDYVGGALPIEYPDVRVSIRNIARAMDAAGAAGIPVWVYAAKRIGVLSRNQPAPLPSIEMPLSS